MILLAILLIIVLSFTKKEGFVNPSDYHDYYMGLAVECLESAKKDVRMTPYQIISLQDAVTYGNYIKNI